MARKAAGRIALDFIIVSASSAEEAIAIARSMPHQRNGGRVVIRAIERT
ncbi:MAG: hypothetical protein WEE89_06080 [Gemmatimonadota bacterium]